MSISPVREAVRRLESLGLAVHVPHRGARVSEVDVDDLHDTYEARSALETLAVRRAAARFTDDDADRARAHLTAFEAAYERGDGRAARAEHAGFHFTLYEASGSEWLVRLIRPAWENCERYRTASLQSEIWSDRRAEHDRILDACIRHDADGAAAELAAHLEVTANLIAHRMGAGDLFPRG
jgi:DNA-binding GntR family transcriptional regulator